MTVGATTFRVHRWLGWLVGVQVLLWVAGGVLFSLVPFEPTVKGGASVVPPRVTLPAGWAERTAPGLRAAETLGGVSGVTVVATPQGPALRVSYENRRPPVLVPADGSTWAAPDEAAVRRFGVTLYRGGGALLGAERITRAPTRLGIVDELAGRGDVWRLRFDDALSTRLYFDGRTGEFITSRNEAWVWYDFFWRLHIMDYGEGEDFNGTLLRVASVTAFGLVLAGALLGMLALRRRWRVWRRAATR